MRVPWPHQCYSENQESNNKNYKIADVLQCPGLLNLALDRISEAVAAWPRQHEGEQPAQGLGTG